VFRCAAEQNAVDWTALVGKLPNFRRALAEQTTVHLFAMRGKKYSQFELPLLVNSKFFAARLNTMQCFSFAIPKSFSARLE
jgi:hypothetical protein